MEDEKKGFSKEEIVKLLAIIIIFIAIFVYSVFSSNDGFKKDNKRVETIDVVKLFEPIKNNYELVIDKTIDDKDEHIDYINDGTFKLYNVNNDNKGYLIYNGKTYVVELKGRKIKEYNKQESFFNDNYSNIDFIKNVVKHCESKIINKNEVNCSVKIDDFIKEYNNYFSTHNIYEGEDEIVFNIKHGNIVNNIEVDYSKVNQFVKNNGKSVVKYNIKIKNTNSNDYSNLFEIFSDTLKK